MKMTEKLYCKVVNLANFDLPFNSLGISVHYDDDYALRYACEHRNLDIIKYLLQIGANIHANNMWVTTPLQSASRYGHLDVIKYLVEVGGANIHDDNDFALDIASLNGHLDVVKYRFVSHMTK
jgi:ankyrin repeat protein